MACFWKFAKDEVVDIVGFVDGRHFSGSFTVSNGGFPEKKTGIPKEKASLRGLVLPNKYGPADNIL